MTEETKVVLSIAGAMVLGLLFFCAADVGKTRARHDYYAGYAAAVDSVRAADRHNEVARVLNLYEVPYDMVIWNHDRTDTACVIHMGVMR